MAILAKLKRAIQSHNKGDYKKASRLYSEIITSDPNNFDALHLLGMLNADTGEEFHALKLIDKAIAIKPDFILARMNKARILLKYHKPQEAIKLLNQIKLETRIDAEILFLCAHAYSDAGLYDKAIAELNSYMNIDKSSYRAFYNLGSLHQIISDFDTAVLYYNKAINICERSIEAHLNLGVSQAKLGRISEAIATFNKCLAIDPKSSSTYTNLGFALKEQGDYHKSIDAFDAAISLDPTQSDAYSGYGYSLIAQKLYKQAIPYLETAYKLNPAQDFLLGKIIHAKLHICDWVDFDYFKEKLVDGIKNNERVSTPFIAVTMFDDSLVHQNASKIFAESLKFPICNVNFCKPNLNTTKRIKIGYFSADFYNHATSYLIAELFQNHDREKFDIVALSFTKAAPDEMTKRIIGSVTNFFDVAEKEDSYISHFSREIGIDIAVDLKGYTDASRPRIFLNRCAPTQINYLGYPGTLSSSVYDYIIVDEIVAPKDQQIFYSETFAYMPNCYQPNDRFRKISNNVPTRAKYGLPENSFVFCSFNNNYKIHPHMFDIWSYILKSVTNSCLWIYIDNDDANQNIVIEAERRGIDQSRIIFATKVPLSDHLARHQCADLMLDTYPCCGHTTTSDSLWAGLPVLTRIGNSFPARVSASLLKSMDIDQLITNSEEEYVKMAIFFGQNPDKLMQIRRSLEINKTKAKLFNNKQYATDLENLYKKMFYERGI